MNAPIEFFGVPLPVWDTLGVWLAGFGAWVAGIAAIYAVRTSLRLAHDQHKTELHVNMRYGFWETENGVSMPRSIKIDVVNKSRKPVQVSEIGWRVREDKEVIYQKDSVIGTDERFATLPTIIAAGTKATYYVTVDSANNQEWIFSFVNGWAMTGVNESDFHTLKIVVSTSDGCEFDAEAGTYIIGELVQYYKEFAH